MIYIYTPIKIKDANYLGFMIVLVEVSERWMVFVSLVRVRGALRTDPKNAGGPRLLTPRHKASPSPFKG